MSSIAAAPEQCWCPDGSEFWCDYCVDLKVKRERARIVAWLRATSERHLHRYSIGDDAAGHPHTAVRALTDGIERGEHMKGEQ